MKVLHISTYDTHGGAAKATYKLHNELLRQGIESKMLVRFKYSKDDTVIEFKPANNIFSKLVRLIRRFIIKKNVQKYQFNYDAYEIYHDDSSDLKSGFEKYIDSQTIINLHWVAGFIDYKSFLIKFSKTNQIYWRLADMNPLTGGCHYDFDCNKFMTGCGKCPQFFKNAGKDITNQSWKRKSKNFSKVPSENLHFICLSKWMAEKLAEHPFFNKFTLSIIPNGIEPTFFNSRNKDASKIALNILPTTKTIVLIANSLESKIKGMQFAIDALNKSIQSNNFFVLLVGKMTNTDLLKFPHYHFGEVSDKLLLSTIYNAADIFLFTSIQDNFPNTALEAIACGTPVVGFATGGIVDIVENNVDGLLTSEFSSESLSKLIHIIFSDNDKMNELQKCCATKAKTLFNINLQAQRYIELYKKFKK